MYPESFPDRRSCPPMSSTSVFSPASLQAYASNAARSFAPCPRTAMPRFRSSWLTSNLPLVLLYPIQTGPRISEIMEIKDGLSL